MLHRILSPFKAVPPAEVPLEDPVEIRRTYRYWRLRMMYAAFIGYAVFYLVRKNISIAIPVMEKQLGIRKANLGLFITLGDLLYGVSKFVNGMLADRANPRYFMALGLFCSAVMNVCFGVSSAVLTFGLFWMFNGWFQGMGFPPCARVLSHWFSPSERGTKWAIWNASHQVGAAVILVLAGYLATRHVALDIGGLAIRLDGWQLCFVVPAAMAMVTVLFLINRLRDTPPSLGLPPVERYRDDPAAAAPPEGAAFSRLLWQLVFTNKFIWIICLANFFVYIQRYAFLNWAPSYLTEVKGVELMHAGWMTAGFEIAGLLGSVCGGWASDTILKARRGPICVFYMLMSLVCVLIFWKAPLQSQLSNAVVLGLLGFFIYGPQFLVGVMTADLSTKHAAATAIGLTGLFGYGSSIISGWGLGWTVDNHGWDGGFGLLVVCAVLATGLFALTWNARASGPASDG